MTIAYALLAIASLLATDPEQQARGTIEQIGNADHAPSTEQIARDPADKVPTTQLSTERRSAEGAAQLTRPSREARPPAQLSSGPASAEGSTPLSTPAQGRTAAVTRVEGDDRCDAADADLDPACRDILEDRADEFARSDPNPLTPEQRLLVEQRLRQSRMSNQGGAARRLAEEGDAETRAAQGIASLVLDRPAAERPVDPAASDPSGLSDIADAIISGILTVPATPPQ